MPSRWICPLCGVGKENFYQLNENAAVPSGEAPQNIMIKALTQSLWQICGRGSCAVTREIGKLFFTQLKTQGITLHNEEDVMKMVNDYFIQVNKFARGLDYEINEDTIELEVTNCRFFGICNQLESQSVLLTTFPYSNTAAAALKKLMVTVIE
ncbi:MAG: rubredoxin [Methanobacteriaceae archaeon]|nr:rubredoxin [Methanobacteriaceae archaeon]MDZ4172743.1 rubredoxin [Methanobacteriaceae archaeon]